MAISGSNSLFFGMDLDHKGLETGIAKATSLIQSMAKNLAKIDPYGSIESQAIDTFARVIDKAQQMSKELEKSIGAIDTQSKASQQNSKDKDLETVKTQYKQIKAAYDNGEKELADALRVQYELKEKTLKKYLRNLYTTAKEAGDIATQAVAVVSLSAIGVPPQPTDKEQKKAHIERLKKLTKQREGDLDKKEKERIDKEITKEETKLEATEKRIFDSLSAEKQYQQRKSEMDGKALRAFLKDIRTKRKAEDESTEEGKKKHEAYHNVLKKRRKEQLEGIAKIAKKTATSFKEVGSLFKHLHGDKETTERINQLGGFLGQTGELFAGIASKNPLAIIKASAGIIKSLFTVEIEADTAKFEKKVKQLEKLTKDLEYRISKAFGQDETLSRGDKIVALKAKEEELKKALEAEAKARKNVKIFGATIAHKGDGSGTSQEKLDELNEKIKQTKRDAEALQVEINQLLTGTSKETIVSELIAGFKEGKIAAEDFTSTFENLMKNALIESFKLQYLKKVSEKFFNEFAKAIDTDEDKVFDLNATEIKQLSNSLKSDLSYVLEGLKSFETILDQAGIEGNLFGTDTQNNQRQGLAGGIKAITEDTANILAGTINSIRIDIKNGLDIATESSEYLSQIALNTSFNKNLERLEVIENKLTSIDDSLSV